MSSSDLKLGWSLDARDWHTVRAWLPWYGWFYHHYFRVKTSGWEQIPADRPVLFVGSHNGGLAAPDMHMFIYDWYRRYGGDRTIYGLMHPLVWDTAPPPLVEMAAKFGAVRAHPKLAIAALRAQASVLVYPGGARDAFRPHRERDRIFFNNHHGFIKLALRENVPIVPLISWGAHDSLIVLADLYPQAKWLADQGVKLWDVDPGVFPLYLGWPWGLGVGPLPNLPWPTQIHTRVCAPITFPRYGRETLQDADYVHRCYTQVVEQMQQALDGLIHEAIAPSNPALPH
jgi:1-acyl-sn-glycerol-3-phosphate acyltransferase